MTIIHVPFARRAIRRCVPLILLTSLGVATLGAQVRADTGQHAAVAAFMRQLAPVPPMDDARFVRDFMHTDGFAFVPESTLVRQLGNMRQASAGLRITRTQPRGAATSMHAKAENGAGAVWLDVQPIDDRLLGWRVRIDQFANSGPPPSLPDRAVPVDSVVPIVQSWLDWWAQHDRWSGTLGVSRNDSTVLIRPVGMADRERGIPNAAETRFHLGSSSKMLTAIAVMQLVQDGRPSLDDTVTKFLPDHPKPDIAKRITVRQLLSHTAGLGGLFDLPRFEGKRRYGSNAAYLPLFADRALLFEPGSRYGYSNEGFLLAGAVVERITGASFDAVIASRILGPAGMTGWCDCMGTPTAPRRAFGYSHRDDTDPLALGPLTDNEYFIFAEGIAAGGYYATAEDYLRLAAAMRRGVLLDSAHQALLFTKSPQSSASRPYGLGMQLTSYAEKAAWGHGGGGGRSGVGTQFATFADGSWTVAVMGNRDLDLATEVLRPLMEFLGKQESDRPGAVDISGGESPAQSAG